ncbi:riboflavin kinase [Tilletia horrida]|uniref:Riboflavin kinase n=1 Tax=Tilletia horrida TaxID=155126 RepID=A0AAN6GM89_9BASI|nr:riboflavin kinase [Tilletia horrida]KAK0546520.1 riboflavin kinase [Tilletia horrida]KAK0562313.1 riboflavin kinase [Tilletia horrida]
MSVGSTTRENRPGVCGPDAGPESPYPLYLEGVIQRGFGRGGKELGCPTANLPSNVFYEDETDSEGNERTRPGLDSTGVYFGYAKVYPPSFAPSGSSAGASGVASDKAQNEETAKDINASEPPPPPRELKEDESIVLPQVMSVGYNPFYGNKTKTAEVHIMHPFSQDFYGNYMKVIILGYIRPELNYVSKEALIEDIETDKRVGLASLKRAAYEAFKDDPFFNA